MNYSDYHGNKRLRESESHWLPPANRTPTPFAKRGLSKQRPANCLWAPAAPGPGAEQRGARERGLPAAGVLTDFGLTAPGSALCSREARAERGLRLVRDEAHSVSQRRGPERSHSRAKGHGGSETALRFSPSRSDASQGTRHGLNHEASDNGASCV